MRRFFFMYRKYSEYKHLDGTEIAGLLCDCVSVQTEHYSCENVPMES